MSKKLIKISFVVLVLALLGGLAATIQPQLTQDEQSVIVDAVLKTINPEGLAQTIAQTVEASVLQKVNGALPLADSTPQPVAEEVAATADGIPAVADASATPESYVGLHAKFVNSYAYTVGGDNGDEITIETEYTPNTLFTFDVVFENDGSYNWPPQVEMRNTGSVSTTGHRPNAIIDTTNNPVKPGDRRGFSISAHGSEAGLSYILFSIV